MARKNISPLIPEAPGAEEHSGERFLPLWVRYGSVATAAALALVRVGGVAYAEGGGHGGGSHGDGGHGDGGHGDGGHAAAQHAPSNSGHDNGHQAATPRAVQAAQVHDVKAPDNHEKRGRDRDNTPRAVVAGAAIAADNTPNTIKGDTPPAAMVNGVLVAPPTPMAMANANDVTPTPGVAAANDVTPTPAAAAGAAADVTPTPATAQAEVEAEDVGHDADSDR